MRCGEGRCMRCEVGEVYEMWNIMGEVYEMWNGGGV